MPYYVERCRQPEEMALHQKLASNTWALPTIPSLTVQWTSPERVACRHS